ncbi:Type II secretory pathway, ATPase PulE/Tfp pilus assembly pathway, ATPase PilB [Enterobacter sp. FY-07]|uniref:type II secretion system protein GspE n=1 Tax=Kosakonia oryzendophytica TaxID=1005665 RepID=UPI0007780DED|nr:type II secretion system protein GspE [Kosakonia oryzendophytica]AMO50552.1 Type II secretory pathway, ATPase PulE/Tfp pilus assembly pathway, ATPase PilB [Enterobacter sp. FY-07]WBT57506.1 type II secretion system protein GspE [Kosakonia oryzendophytica]
MKHDKLIALCQRHNAALLNCADDVLTIAVVDNPSPMLMESLSFAIQQRVDIRCWTQDQMDKHQQMAVQTHPPAQGEESSAAAEILDQTLKQALILRASDIHFEPGETCYAIRLRVDGVLHPLSPLSCNLAATLTARLKVLGNLDIAERRLPQDGQFSVELSGQSISFRIATLPCRHGEKVVLRLLHQVSQALDLAALGMTDAQLALFTAALAQPQGLLLVTGPTGSGKTVTLYSALQKRNRPEVNICSVEDPIEIPLDGLNQTQINPRAGLTFQGVLRAMLRQDPDIIMVGEIRDGETAEIAIKASQTGHLVLSTLHTNSTSETLVRIQQMGVARWMISSALSLVIAQRLVRKLCPHCRKLTTENTRLPGNLWPRPLPRWRAEGCDRCYHGFYGRVALFEVLSITRDVRQAITSGQSAAEIEQCARAEGMTTLFQHGCLAVEQGLTTLEELVRILGLPNDD